MQYSDMRNFGYTNKLFSKGPDSDEFLKTIEKELPPVVSRSEAARITGGLISPKTLSNEDALGRGPTPRVRIGSKVGYTREAIMGYLRRKIKNI